MSSRYIKDFSKEEANQYYPNTGGHVAAKGVDAYARDPERFLSIKAEESLKQIALSVVKNMRSGYDDSFMNQGDLPEDWIEALKKIDNEVGTTFEYGLEEIKKAYLKVFQSVTQFGDALERVANNELE